MPALDDRKAKRHQLSIEEVTYAENLAVDEVEEKISLKKDSKEGCGCVIFRSPIAANADEILYFQFRLQAPDLKHLTRSQRAAAQKKAINPKIYIGLCSKNIIANARDIFRQRDSGMLCLNLNTGDKFFQRKWR